MNTENNSKPIIEVKNISKVYKIVHQRGKYITLADTLSNILRHPFSFLKHKTKNVIGRDTKEKFWALNDVSFNINKGEVVGVIGNNGAGKSTLLKILSQITPPTSGEIILRGKVGSLLEVGTGFHPELTGRENIFLNGAILGMTRQKMKENFDAIVEFAGIEKFLDTPVKYYSSGMYVRLAFSVAAHLEPDILLVDEVLAVGDAEFQKKCLGKMEDVTKNHGRTILFVSHNMSAIQNLCKRSILLNSGKVEMIGETRDVIEHYLSNHTLSDAVTTYDLNEKDNVQISKISLINNQGEFRSEFPISEDFKIEIDFKNKETISNSTLSLLFYSNDRDLLLYSSESDKSGSLITYKNGEHKTTVSVPAFMFNPGKYSFEVIIHEPNIKMHTQKKDIYFEIKNVNNPRSVVFQGKHPGKVASILDYKSIN